MTIREKKSQMEIQTLKKRVNDLEEVRNMTKLVICEGVFVWTERKRETHTRETGMEN